MNLNNICWVYTTHELHQINIVQLQCVTSWQCPLYMYLANQIVCLIMHTLAGHTGLKAVYKSNIPVKSMYWSVIWIPTPWSPQVKNKLQNSYMYNVITYVLYHNIKRSLFRNTCWLSLWMSEIYATFVASQLVITYICVQICNNLLHIGTLLQIGTQHTFVLTE